MDGTACSQMDLNATLLIEMLSLCIPCVGIYV